MFIGNFFFIFIKIVPFYLLFHFYSRLFSQQRQLKKLFTKLMAREFSGELVFDEMKLKAHGKIVMDALGAAVECLDDSTQLTSLLIGIGERHALYGVQPNMVPVVANFVISKIFFFRKLVV